MWRKTPPALVGDSVVLSEAAARDAAGLLEVLSAEEVVQYFTPPPSTLAAVRRYITWARSERRRRGTYMCLIVRRGGAVAGFFQLYRTTSGWRTAELGFGLQPRYWGTGLFRESAGLVFRFAFETLGLHRLEARIVSENHRANAAMRKLGATAEGVLRESFGKDGRYFDQTLWSLLRTDAKVE